MFLAKKNVKDQRSPYDFFVSLGDKFFLLKIGIKFEYIFLCVHTAIFSQRSNSQSNLYKRRFQTEPFTQSQPKEAVTHEICYAQKSLHSKLSHTERRLQTKKTKKEFFDTEAFFQKNIDTKKSLPG